MEAQKKGEKGRISCLPPHEAPRHAVIEEDVAVQRVNAQHDELELGTSMAEFEREAGRGERLYMPAKCSSRGSL